VDTKYLKFEDLNYQQLDALDREKTLFLLSLGPIEEHGPHLPLGVDVFVAEFMAEKIIEAVAARYPEHTIVKFPPLYVGSGGIRWLGTLNSKQRTVRKIILDYCRNLGKHGFKYVLISNGHGGLGHVVALEEAARYASRVYNMSVISPSGRIAYDFLTGAYINEIERELGYVFSEEEREQLKNDSHAGWWETSVMLLIRPELVKDDYPRLKPYTLTRRERMLNKCYPGDPGYRGYPHKATPAYAEAAVKVMLRHTMELVDEWLTGADMKKKVSSPLYRLMFFRTNFDRFVLGGLGLILAIIVWFTLIA